MCTLVPLKGDQHPAIIGSALWATSGAFETQPEKNRFSLVFWDHCRLVGHRDAFYQ
jgi:hypothetical protein